MGRLRTGLLTTIHVRFGHLADARQPQLLAAHFSSAVQRFVSMEGQ